MKLNLNQLPAHLKQNLSPLYWISGDEPLLTQEANLSIRAAATLQNFLPTPTITVDATLSIEELHPLTHNLSLFADKQIFELIIPGTVPEKFSSWLKAYCESPNTDNLLIIRSGKLSTAQSNTAWFKAFDKAGVHVPIWPIELLQLPAWLQQRAQRWQLKLPIDAAQYLANRTEGNLLSACQELEKLALSYSGQTININMLTALLEDQARFDIFNLTSAVLKGETSRVWRILQHLKNDSSEYTLIVWSLSKELRNLIFLHQQKHKTSLSTLYKQLQIWDKRIPEVQVALNRLHLEICQQSLQSAAEVDQAIKGVAKQDAWEALSTWVMNLAGGPSYHA